MPDAHDDNSASTPFDELIEESAAAGEQPSGSSFSVGFRGYDRTEVDAAIADLTTRLQSVTADLQAAGERRQGALDDLRAEHTEELARVSSDLDVAIDRLTSERDSAAELLEQTTAELRGEIAAQAAQLAETEKQVATLTAELAGAPLADTDDPANRQQFEAVLKVAEEQANLLIQNAATQADRLLESAREEVAAQRATLDADVERVMTQARHDADQVRLRIETEYTAHEARIARESAHAAEKISQAEQEAATVRTEAEKGAAALRSMVTRETTQQRADAEREVREMNARVLEFEETLTRRQDDAQQEFLLLHNQAVAHAERITTDANEQVASSLDHAQRISAKADDYERLMRAQAQQIEADAQVKAREILERARTKANKIVDTVTGHTNSVVRDAEDRTRQLRWQQQQLTSFMAEVRELIRPDGVSATAEAADTDAGDEPSDEASTDAADAKSTD